MNSGLRFVLIAILVVILVVSGASLFVRRKDPLYYSVITLIIISVLFILVTINRIHEKYLEDDPMLIEIREKLRPVFPEVDSIVLLKGRKSYTINKKYVHLCLKDENGKYYEKNMLIYVALHELAHVKCKEIGHTPEFHRVFEEILQKDIKAGVYNDKIPTIKNYCEY